MDLCNCETKEELRLKECMKNSDEVEEQKCRVCGCTWNNACQGGCYWVEEDLCSECIEEVAS